MNEKASHNAEKRPCPNCGEVDCAQSDPTRRCEQYAETGSLKDVVFDALNADRDPDWFIPCGCGDFALSVDMAAAYVAEALTDTAIWPKELIARREATIRRLVMAMREALNELGVPTPDYPAPVANAVAILGKAIGIDGQDAPVSDAGTMEP